MQKLEKTRRKHLKTKKEKKNFTKRKTKKNRNTVYPAHEPPRKINISKGLAGRFLFCFMCLYVFLRVVMCVLCVYVFVRL